MDASGSSDDDGFGELLPSIPVPREPHTTTISSEPVIKMECPNEQEENKENKEGQQVHTATTTSPLNSALPTAAKLVPSRDECMNISTQLPSSDDDFGLLAVPKAGRINSRPSSSDALEEARFDLRSAGGPHETPTHHSLNFDALSTWQYPVNMPIREYQRNIVAKALVKNLVVALPTGLGKTFIASVVMFNWWRWTRSAKIIFVAPTRPLVAQQVKSFLETTGVPLSEVTALLQAVVPIKSRADEWIRKRVFFATAQTIENDLNKGLVDPRDIALLVLDEAHKAVGNHSYVNVVQTISRTNPSFRILALTATPSGKLDGVQVVIDNLNIAQTEIRTENSLDIRKYTHARQIERRIVDLSPQQDELLDRIARALRDQTNLLLRWKLVHTSDATAISHFGLLEGIKRLRNPNTPGNEGARFAVMAAAKFILPVVYATGLLKTHGIYPFYERMRLFDADLQKSKGKNAGYLRANESYREILSLCKSWIFLPSGERNPQFIGHPKLPYLIDIVSDFFLQHGADSRIIIFTELRESAAEIQWALGIHCPQFVRSRLFVGQATSSMHKIGGTHGMNQKQQQELLHKFKAGEVNVLIATSIAEEGLDIGQVDMIICYDQSQSPIRSIQRMGRTGRARDGYVYMLMTPREQQKLAQALEGHKYIRDRINPGLPTLRSSALDLHYHPPTRIIPNTIVPRYEEVVIKTPPENEALLATDDIILALRPTKRQRQPSRPSKRRQAKGHDISEEAGEAPVSTNRLENFGFRCANEIEYSGNQEV